MSEKNRIQQAVIKLTDAAIEIDDLLSDELVQTFGPKDAYTKKYTVNNYDRVQHPRLHALRELHVGIRVLQGRARNYAKQVQAD